MELNQLRKRFTNRPFIVGGFEPRIKDLPWHVAAGFKSNSSLFDHRGSGALLSDRFVLTAFHVVTKILREGSEILIRYGSERYESNYNQVSARVTAEWCHADLALLELTSALKISETVSAITILTAEEFRSQFQIGQSKPMGIVSGWGKQDSSGFGSTYALDLRATYMYASGWTTGDYLRRSCDCDPQLIAETEFFYCQSPEGSGPCEGDSGGGFVLFPGGQVGLAGITKGFKTNHVCHSRGSPAHFADATALKQEIENHLS